MDAGVPIKRPVAGIAMGMLLGDKSGVSDDDAVILSDILGTEDALGTMDFKVAGDREGITTFQLDIKCEGLTVETMERALEQAREGRLHILDAMDEVLAAPRSELPPTVPKITSFSISPDSIGKVIGPGGKQIRAIIEDFELSNMDVDDSGSVQVSGFNSTSITAAQEFIQRLVSNERPPKQERPKYVGPEPEVGKNYKGKITGIHKFGVFAEILPGAKDGSTPGLEGLCHVSELHTEHVRNCEGFVKSWGSDVIDVKYLGVNEKGQLRLSRKAFLEEKNGKKPSSKPSKPKTDGAAKTPESKTTAASAAAAVANPQEEESPANGEDSPNGSDGDITEDDVIANAIDSVSS